MWSTINEKHYDPTFGGVNWAEVRELYLPKAKAATTDHDFHNVLKAMKQAHAIGERNGASTA